MASQMRRRQCARDSLTQTRFKSRPQEPFKKWNKQHQTNSRGAPDTNVKASAKQTKDNNEIKVHYRHICNANELGSHHDLHHKHCEILAMLYMD